MNEGLCVLTRCHWWVVTTDTTPGRYPTQCMKVSQTHPVTDVTGHDCTTGGPVHTPSLTLIPILRRSQQLHETATFSWVDVQYWVFKCWFLLFKHYTTWVNLLNETKYPIILVFHEMIYWWAWCAQHLIWHWVVTHVYSQVGLGLWGRVSVTRLRPVTEWRWQEVGSVGTHLSACCCAGGWGWLWEWWTGSCCEHTAPGPVWTTHSSRGAPAGSVPPACNTTTSLTRTDDLTDTNTTSLTQTWQPHWHEQTTSVTQTDDLTDTNTTSLTQTWQPHWHEQTTSVTQTDDLTDTNTTTSLTRTDNLTDTNRRPHWHEQTTSLTQTDDLTDTNRRPHWHEHDNLTDTNRQPHWHEYDNLTDTNRQPQTQRDNLTDMDMTTSLTRTWQPHWHKHDNLTDTSRQPHWHEYDNLTDTNRQPHWHEYDNLTDTNTTSLTWTWQPHCHEQATSLTWTDNLTGTTDNLTGTNNLINMNTTSHAWTEDFTGTNTTTSHKNRQPHTRTVNFPDMNSQP